MELVKTALCGQGSPVGLRASCSRTPCEMGARGKTLYRVPEARISPADTRSTSVDFLHFEVGPLRHCFQVSSATPFRISHAIYPDESGTCSSTCSYAIYGLP